MAALLGAHLRSRSTFTQTNAISVGAAYLCSIPHTFFGSLIRALLPTIAIAHGITNSEPNVHALLPTIAIAHDITYSQSNDKRHGNRLGDPRDHF